MITYLKSAIPSTRGSAVSDPAVADTVARILDDVRSRGDEAVRHYSHTLDAWSPESFRLSQQQIDDIVASLPQQVLDDIEFVQAQVRRFAQHQRASLTDFEVLTRGPRRALTAMQHYGALFLGEGTCVSYGDKVIGTNHVLPTRGNARFTGGLWVGKYLRTVTYQEVTDPASSAMLGEICGRASRVELFEGHARSGDVRAAKYGAASLTWSDHKFAREPTVV